MERLQKVLAQAGLASRRAAEQIIAAGRVRVDGRIVTELGTQVDPRKSRVEVDGNKIVAEKLVYIVLHKPRGVVCTLSDPEGRPTIHELIKSAGARLVPVGRLDFHTSGALLCTNDGEFAQGLAHPKRSVPKVYVAKVKGTVDDEAMDRFSERIEIDGRQTLPAQVKRLRFEGDKTWLEITLREGRNRQVRRLGEATGFPVMRLARISHAGVTSEELRPGQWRELTLEELIALKRDYGVPKKVRSPSIEHDKGRLERGEGPAARFDKRAPRTESRVPKRSEAANEIRGEHWSRETPRPSRGGDLRDTPPTRSTRRDAPASREAAVRGAAPRGERREGSARDTGPRGKRSDGGRRERTPEVDARGPSRKPPFARDNARPAGRKPPFARDEAPRDARAGGRKPPFARDEAPRDARAGGRKPPFARDEAPRDARAGGRKPPFARDEAPRDARAGGRKPPFARDEAPRDARAGGRKPPFARDEAPRDARAGGRKPPFAHDEARPAGRKPPLARDEAPRHARSAGRKPSFARDEAPRDARSASRKSPFQGGAKESGREAPWAKRGSEKGAPRAASSYQDREASSAKRGGKPAAAAPARGAKATAPRSDHKNVVSPRRHARESAPRRGTSR